MSDLLLDISVVRHLPELLTVPDGVLLKTGVRKLDHAGAESLEQEIYRYLEMQLSYFIL